MDTDRELLGSTVHVQGVGEGWVGMFDGADNEWVLIHFADSDEEVRIPRAHLGTANYRLVDEGLTYCGRRVEEGECLTTAEGDLWAVADVDKETYRVRLVPLERPNGDVRIAEGVGEEEVDWRDEHGRFRSTGRYVDVDSLDTSPTMRPLARLSPEDVED